MYENATNNEINILLVQLERQFERLKRRIKRHGVRYLRKYSVDDNTETLAGNNFDKNNYFRSLSGNFRYAMFSFPPNKQEMQTLL